MSDRTSADCPVISARHPAPARGLRFRLTKSMQEKLATHRLGRDLMPLSAGADYKVGDRRSYSLEPVPGLLIAYCSAGEGELHVRGQRYPIRAGDLVVLRKDEKVFLGPLPNSIWTNHFVVCEGELANDYFDHLKIGEAVIQIGSQPRITACIDAIVALRTAVLRSDVFIDAACRVKNLLTWLAVIIADRPGDDTRERIDESVRYMIAKLDSHIDLDELAQICGMSRYYFVRKFRERNGESPIHYFIHLKIQRACELLETTEFDVKKIAESLGYDDPFYFSKLFKRSTGQSPQHFRLSRVT